MNMANLHKLGPLQTSTILDTGDLQNIEHSRPPQYWTQETSTISDTANPHNIGLRNPPNYQTQQSSTISDTADLHHIHNIHNIGHGQIPFHKGEFLDTTGSSLETFFGNEAECCDSSHGRHWQVSPVWGAIARHLNEGTLCPALGASPG